MQQKPFGGSAPPGPAGKLTDLLAGFKERFQGLRKGGEWESRK